MYPDVQDVRTAMPKLAGAPSAESIWEDVVFAHSILFEAKRACYNDGRHSQNPVSDLLKFVERVIGREILPWAFVTALRLLGMKSNPPMLNPNELSKATVKFPPTSGFPVEGWRERCFGDLNQEIADETKEMARRHA
jgi:hypothetical protein